MTDNRRRTPLIIAINYNRSDIATLLIVAGADVKLRNKFGKSAVDIARKRGVVKTIALVTKAARRQEATLILNSLLAMAPLELPICEYDLA